jgi:hypothetical protein
MVDEAPKRRGRPPKEPVTPEKKPGYTKKTVITTKEEAYSRLMKDRDLYFENCLKIRDKNSEIVPFRINDGQRKLHQIVEDWEERYPDPKTRPTLRVIILKARQIGFSTDIEGLIYHKLQFERLKIGMVVSFDEDSATNINDIAKRYYQYSPQAVKPVTRPARGKGILFENPAYDPYKPVASNNNPGLESKFLIETAKNQAAGSSYTINYLHLSEIAKWPGDPATTMTSIMQSVPQTGGMVFVESTANGFNFFADLWENAVKGINGFVPLFIPWFSHKEYIAKLDSYERDAWVKYTDKRATQKMLDRAQMRMKLTPEEERLIKDHKLTFAQIKWRRECIANNCNGDINMFMQEYPATPEEAFLSTGTPVFDNYRVIERLKALRTRYKSTVHAPKVGKVLCELDEFNDCKRGTAKWQTDRNGELLVYKHPEKGRPYVIGIDTAEGGIDFSVMQVLDNVTGEQVAKWRGHCDGDLLARYAFALGEYYNDALLGFETNKDKHPVKECARMGYSRLYVRETLDKITHKIKPIYGFETTGLTRPFIIGELVTVAREQTHWITDTDTLEEMLVFVRGNDGRPEAQSGKHDDCVMALAIAYAIRGQQSVVPQLLEEERGIDRLPDDVTEDYYQVPMEERAAWAARHGLYQI